MQAPSLESSVVIKNDTNGNIVSLAQELSLVVLSRVKECRRKSEAPSPKARHDTIKSALVILQATTGRDKPDQSEFEMCSQKIISLVSELPGFRAKDLDYQSEGMHLSLGYVLGCVHF